MSLGRNKGRNLSRLPSVSYAEKRRVRHEISNISFFHALTVSSQGSRDEKFNLMPTSICILFVAQTHHENRTYAVAAPMVRSAEAATLKETILTIESTRYHYSCGFLEDMISWWCLLAFLFAFVFRWIESFSFFLRPPS